MPTSSPAFQAAYSALNDEQRLAVDTIEGPVMVIAGPGTGKTQILATRIANILLSTDTNPSSILALTFTESGATAMRKRLVSMIGETAYAIRIQTFHSFCTDIIQSEPEYFPMGGLGEPISDLDRFHVFEQILRSNQFQHIKPINTPLHYLKDLMSAIQDLKREGISPESFKHILTLEQSVLDTEADSMKKTVRASKEKELAKNWELLQVYQAYQQRILELGTYDFEDMISLTVDAFRAHPLLLQTYQEKLLYILVDEYQDTNSAQNTVVDLLASYWQEAANVFVVGDPNQSIYRFQGASLENTYSFLHRYPTASVITLQQNYRSTQSILDAAKAVIDHNQVPQLPAELRFEQHLQSQKRHHPQLTLVEPVSQQLEHIYFAQTIEKLLAAGEQPRDIAIIFHNNADAVPIADTLARWHIPYALESGENVLQHPFISQLFTLFRVIRDIRSSVEDIDYFTLLSYDWVHLDPLVVLKLTRAAADQRTHIYTLLSEMHTETPDNAAPLAESDMLLLGDTHRDIADAQELSSKQVVGTSERATAFIATLSHTEVATLTRIVDLNTLLTTLSAADAQLSFPEWFEQAITRSGYLDAILSAASSIVLLNALNSLFAHVKQQTRSQPQLKLADFLSNIALMQQHKISVPEQEIAIERDAVRLITAHKSKGLEWKHVFLSQLHDTKWGKSSKRRLIKLPEGILQHTQLLDDSQLDDERRLFYVAITRAKDYLYLSCPQTTSTGTSTRDAVPSLFVQEIPAALLDTKEWSLDDQELSHTLTKLIAPIPRPTIQTDEQEFLAGLIAKFKLSPTALNTFLACPYKFKLEKLLKVPKAKAAYLSYGTAAHKALETLFSHMMQQSGQVPPLSDVLQAYTSALQKELLTADEYVIRLQQGEQILTQYYNTYREEFLTPLAVEKIFGSGFSKPFLGTIPLTGRIDKIELLDAAARTVKVIDYKTGKPKTRGQIVGTTKDSKGDYKRQLVFYALLAQLDPAFKYSVQQGEFDFLEPHANGSLKRERIEIVEEDIELLQTTIIEVMQKITAQQFERTTDYSLCAKCDFKNHCWPNGIPHRTADSAE